MPKVTLKRVLEALTPNTSTHPSTSLSLNTSNGNKEPNFSENLSANQFQPCKTIRHGFPNNPTALAYDPVQKLLAIGCFAGYIRIFGQSGVDCHISHESSSAVVQLVFLANQGALVSVCADDTIHLWNLRQKKPAILHSLKFKKECITCCHLPYQCKWIYIGTKRGNTHLCNVEKFTVSGYAINWNKAIDLSQKTHPGHVVSIRENPVDENKVLLCFSSGLATLWDLKSKSAEHKYHCASGIRHACWHFEGKQFMLCHDNGSLTTWNCKSDLKPQSEQFPHAKREGDSCFPIDKVQWLCCRNASDFVVFSGGISRSFHPRPTVTVMRGRSITVLEVDYSIIDFVGMDSTPWNCDFQDPTALTILTDKELVVVDLESPGYPSIELGHVMDIHDSPVTCLKHVSDPNTDLIPGLYKVSVVKPQHDVGCTKVFQYSPDGQARSLAEWPINGGECGVSECDGFPEVFVTGHADGSVRFWDASAVSLKALYKLRTKKIFKKDAESTTEEDDPLQITHISLCPESRVLAVANSSSAVATFKLEAQESQCEITTLNIPHVNEAAFNEVTNDNDGHNCVSVSNAHPSTHTFDLKEPAASAEQDANMTSIDSAREPSFSKQESRVANHSPPHRPLLRVKSGELRQGPGFHVELVCFLLGNEIDPPSPVVSMTMNTSYQLLAIGSTTSLCVVDMVQKTTLLNLSTDGLLASIDKKVHPRSPNRVKAGFSETVQNSFSFDQSLSKTPADDVIDGVLKPNTKNPVSLGAVPKKSRLTRKSLGEYFANSPLPFRRNSLLPKTSVPSTPPLRTRRTQAAFTKTVLSPILSSPEEEQAPHPARLKPSLSNGPCEAEASESCRSDPFSDPPGSHSQHTSTSSFSSRSVQREPSVSSVTGVTVGAPRLKKHASRTYKKAGSCSFERSVDSTTSADDSVFSRTSSLQQGSFESERSTSNEVSTFLSFSLTYAKKSDTSPSPCLWVGTSGGYLFNVTFSIPSTCEERSSQFVVVAPSGSLLQMKSGIVHCAFLDSCGNHISAGAGNWREHCSASHSISPQSESPETNKERNHAPVDKQFLVVCSETQAKVFSLPSQSCTHTTLFNVEMGSIVRATVDSTSHGTFLACYSIGGYLLVYSLPSLTQLMKESYLPVNDDRVLNTFCFSPNARAVYCASPSEIQRIAFCVDTYESIQETVGQLFIPRVPPERPNPGFFKGLFGGGHTSVDREELFGKSGVGSRAFAEHIPGTGGSSLEGLRGTSSGLGAEMQRLRMQAQERGEKLSELQDSTQRMQDNAMKFSSDAHALAQKFKNKKWYQL